ncbi:MULTISPECIES: peptidoglycan-binding protein [unclassified Sphingomonas]|uniref:peptidoglycan-binding protein n=1 Tax=Novosphingobium rhizosphaerae TaxID=1551649 RepID=UPI0015C7F10F
MIDIRTTQTRLKAAGYDPGPVDGDWGAKTCTALLAHQAQRQPDDALRALGVALAPELLAAGIVDTPQRLAELLGQTGNETGGYTKFAEDMRYSSAGMMRIWKQRFPTVESTLPYLGKPRALANYVYGSRMGNQANGTTDDDGWDHRGGGLIQHTGAAEYKLLADRLGVTSAQIHGGDPVPMARALCDYWGRVKANGYCDRGDFVGLRRRVNGGLVGLEEVARRRARSLGVIA